MHRVVSYSTLELRAVAGDKVVVYGLFEGILDT